MARRRQVANWIAATLAIPLLPLAVVLVCYAAPAPKPQDATLTGDFDWAGSAPTVYVPRDDGTPARVWLVFASDDRESTAKAFQDKDRVRVTGRAGQGGEYRYFVVSKIERAE